MCDGEDPTTWAASHVALKSTPKLAGYTLGAFTLCSEGLLWKIYSDTIGCASDDSLGKHRVAGVIRPKTAREAYTARRSEWYQL